MRETDEGVGFERLTRFCCIWQTALEAKLAHVRMDRSARKELSKRNVEKPIKCVENLFQITPVVRLQVAKGNKPVDLRDAQLDPEIHKPIASSFPGAAHALCRPSCVTRNPCAHCFAI